MRETFVLSWWRELAIMILIGAATLMASQWKDAHDELVGYKATVAQERRAQAALDTEAITKTNDTVEKLKNEHKADLLTQAATIESNFRARFRNSCPVASGIRIPVPSGVRDTNTPTTPVDSQGSSTSVLDEPSAEQLAFAKACGADAQQVMDFQKLVRSNHDLMQVEGE